MTASHQTVRLQAGSHEGPAGGVCVMELASMLSGERFSDRPACVSSVVAALLRGYNDGLDSERRQTLKRFAADAVGTADDDVSERTRRRIAAQGIGAAIAEHGPRHLLARTYVVLFPYHAARGRARHVAASDDDALHERLCTAFDGLMAAGPGDPVPVTPAAPGPPRSSPAPRSAGRSG
ncbi:MAG TPA: hypothetical protein VFG42_01465 [Baekduia sp.]|uniref:hypothetical protein n=1 Tax=Baekduia sp. TaxID=2600305 RepID=UPI002D781868|nr:hypothetical protein [Baekduia sp.]HET6505431.1 hypothetical protein [Baekduia sp.]